MFKVICTKYRAKHRIGNKQISLKTPHTRIESALNYCLVPQGNLYGTENPVKTYARPSGEYGKPRFGYKIIHLTTYERTIVRKKNDISYEG